MGTRELTSRRLTGLAAASAVCAALALGLAATSTASSEVGVTIVSRAYQPAALTIDAGQTVTWTNRGFTPHTVTALGGEFDSGRLNVGESFKVTFSTPGTFAYKCEIHPSMRGSVTVLAPGSAPSPGPLGPAQSVHVSLAKVRSAHGQLTLVHVQAAHPAARVVLELRVPKASSWRVVARAHLNALGKATLSVGASVRGRLRVVVEGTGGLPPLISKTLTPPR
ncbi:MAG TPA: cupredoxin family copper-binding protein [Solirubrobacteraceae bacterium]|jgi:plastocyanin|nr:cupredoxin family copper-binding protein [Solirubrobacteraceae bacterium]